MKFLSIIKVCFILVLLYLVSCVRDHETSLDGCLVDVRIELDWIGVAPLDDNEELDLFLDPADVNRGAVAIKSDISGVNVNKDKGVYPGEYLMTAWESAENASVAGMNVTVGKEDDGTAKEAGNFSAGYSLHDIAFNKGRSVYIIPLYRQVRALHLIIKIQGDGLGLVSGIDAVIDGVTISRDLKFGFSPQNGLNRNPALENGSMKFNSFELTGDDPVEGKIFEDSKRLIGIDGEAVQQLGITIYNTMGYEPGTLTESVSDKLLDFHTVNVFEPYYIEVTIDVGADLAVTIIDWAQGPESDYVAI